MRCSSAACLLSSALELLHTGRVSMAMRLIEQTLRAERARVEQAKPVKAPARTRKARVRV